MIVRLTPEAAGDLEQIGDWIARDDPARAVTFVAELRERCMELRELFAAFPIVEELEPEGIRRRNYRRYAILYSVVDEVIVVLRVVHGARDIPELI